MVDLWVALAYLVVLTPKKLKQEMETIVARTRRRMDVLAPIYLNARLEFSSKPSGQIAPEQVIC